MELHLTPRLQAAVSLIGPDGGVADIGTDHAYLPAALALMGRAGRLVAADLREGPLARARETAARYGVTRKLEFCLSDGLEHVSPEGLGWIVICGMGGETIRGILERAAWLKHSDAVLVLQPQSKQEELAEWLSHEGWGLCDTAMAKDAGRIYPLFSVKRKAGGECWGELDVYSALVKKREPLLREFLEQRLNMYRDALCGMRRGGEAVKERAAAMERLICALEAIRKETEAW
ncbi:MAG: SAM-dependent methyltransferase [Oscillospiraceae bacterium]|nr:SAM-dependent methyltransferase [Oscillospiraceae bacterium]